MMPRMEDVQVAVMMGGVGSRLGDIVASCPKEDMSAGSPASRCQLSKIHMQ